jgi:hypothetical protein
MSKACSEKVDQNFDVSFSSAFLVLSRFRVFLCDVSSKTPPKPFCKKLRRISFLQKNRQKKQKVLI